MRQVSLRDSEEKTPHDLSVNPADPRPYREQRNELLPAARGLTLVALMKRYMSDPTIHEANLSPEKAAAYAKNVMAYAERAYGDTGREYHTLQHPLVQMSSGDVQHIIKSHKQGLEQQGTVGLYHQFSKLLTPTQAMELCDQLHHDTFHAAPAKSTQRPTLIAALSGKTIRQILDHPLNPADPAFAQDFTKALSTQLIAGNARLPSLTIGELAARIFYPDGQGGINNAAMIDPARNNRTISEFVSTVMGLKAEHTYRGGTLGIADAFRMTAAIESTVPFANQQTADQRLTTLRKVLNHLYKYDGAQQQLETLAAQLNVRQPKKFDDLAKGVFTYTTQLSNRDVRNFGEKDPLALYWGDIGTKTEFTGVYIPKAPALLRIKASHEMGADHQPDGFMYRVVNAQNGMQMYHTGGAVKPEYIAALRENYNNNAALVSRMHFATAVAVAYKSGLIDLPQLAELPLQRDIQAHPSAINAARVLETHVSPLAKDLFNTLPLDKLKALSFGALEAVVEKRLAREDSRRSKTPTRSSIAPSSTHALKHSVSAPSNVVESDMKEQPAPLQRSRSDNTLDQDHRRQSRRSLTPHHQSRSLARKTTERDLAVLQTSHGRQ